MITKSHFFQCKIAFVIRYLDVIICFLFLLFSGITWSKQWMTFQRTFRQRKRGQCFIEMKTLHISAREKTHDIIHMISSWQLINILVGNLNFPILQNYWVVTNFLLNILHNKYDRFQIQRVCINDIHISWEIFAKSCRRYQISISFPFELFCTHG